MPRKPSSAKDAAITHATVELLLSTGYARLSMEAVAARAAVSKRTLYKRFASKAALVDHVAAALFAELQQSSPIAPRFEDDLAGALTEFVDRVASFLLDPVVLGLLRVAIAEAVVNPALAAAFVEHGKRPVEQALAEYLRQRPELDLQAPDIAALQLLGMVKEAVVWPQVLSPEKRLTNAARKQLIASAINVFLRAHVRCGASTSLVAGATDR